MKNNYPDLDIILEKNKVQKEIYLPSSFWRNASQKIVDDIQNFGVENFRKLQTPLSFFVPTYGIPTNAFSKESKNEILKSLKNIGTKKQFLAMDEFLSGYAHALSDYRVFMAAEDESKKPSLKSFSESDYGQPIEQFEFEGKKFSRSSLNYILGLCFLKTHLKDKDEIKTVLEIGGGFGTLGEVLNSAGGIKYIDIDIPPISYVAWNYLNNIHTGDTIEPYVHHKEEIIIGDLKPCTVLNSWDIEKLRGTIDLFVNSISFQEMEPPIVKNYLKHVKRLKPKYIMLRNLREGKQLRTSENSVGVEVQIKKEDYLSMLDESYDLIATSVFPYGHKTVDGFHSELLLFIKKDE